MNRITVLLSLSLMACASATPFRELPPNKELVSPIAMNPDKKICRYLETVLVRAAWSGSYDRIMEDIRHHATTQGANVYRIVRLFGGRRDTDVELYSCPNDYIAKFKKQNYTSY